jgi:hypothetical protein
MKMIVIIEATITKDINYDNWILPGVPKSVA